MVSFYNVSHSCHLSAASKFVTETQLPLIHDSKFDGLFIPPVEHLVGDNKEVRHLFVV